MNFGNVISDISLLSSVTIILGSVFVIVQLQNNKLIEVATEQAKTAGVQARLTTEQMKQNNDLANMDMLMRLYEFANTSEFQTAWVTVLNSRVNTFDDFLELPKADKSRFIKLELCSKVWVSFSNEVL